MCLFFFFILFLAAIAFDICKVNNQFIPTDYYYHVNYAQLEGSKVFFSVELTKKDMSGYCIVRNELDPYKLDCSSITPDVDVDGGSRLVYNPITREFDPIHGPIFTNPRYKEEFGVDPNNCEKAIITFSYTLEEALKIFGGHRTGNTIRVKIHFHVCPIEVADTVTEELGVKINFMCHEVSLDVDVQFKHPDYNKTVTGRSWNCQSNDCLGMCMTNTIYDASENVQVDSVRTVSQASDPYSFQTTSHIIKHNSKGNLVVMAYHTANRKFTPFQPVYFSVLEKQIEGGEKSKGRIFQYDTPGNPTCYPSQVSMKEITEIYLSPDFTDVKESAVFRKSTDFALTINLPHTKDTSFKIKLPYKISLFTCKKIDNSCTEIHQSFETFQLIDVTKDPKVKEKVDKVLGSGFLRVMNEMRVGSQFPTQTDTYMKIKFDAEIDPIGRRMLTLEEGGEGDIWSGTYFGEKGHSFEWPLWYYFAIGGSITAGIAVIGVVIFAVVITILCCCYKMRKSKYTKLYTTEERENFVRKVY